MKLLRPYRIIGKTPLIVDAFAAELTPSDFNCDIRRTHSAHMQNTRAIILRNSEAHLDTLAGIYNKTSTEITNFTFLNKYSKYVDPILLELKKHYEFNDYAALIGMVLPKSSIGLHTDHGVFLESCNRVHIPIITNVDCFFIVGGEQWHMAKGIIYEIDNTRMHGVVNNGLTSRIHLIINLYRADNGT